MEGFPSTRSIRTVEWNGLEQIPSHWSVKRNISLFDERKEVNHPEMDLYISDYRVIAVSSRERNNNEKGLLQRRYSRNTKSFIRVI